LGIDKVGIHDNFFELGGDSLKAMQCIVKLQERLGRMIWVSELFENQTVADLSCSIQTTYKHLPDVESAEVKEGGTGFQRDDSKETINFSMIRKMENILAREESNFFNTHNKISQQNKRAIFILSTFRSGSTLLRIILGGHQGLFSPPEMELLTFGTLSERESYYTGAASFWKDGLLRAIMELKKCDYSRAKIVLNQYIRNGTTVKELYSILQSWIGDRVLVDKTASYSMHSKTLSNAERYFKNSLYIHLARHPQAMIQSYIEGRMSQLFRKKYPFSLREQAELIWLISQKNIMRFLEGISPSRKMRIKYEDLVANPQLTVKKICEFLRVHYDSKMLDVYDGDRNRMADGVTPTSLMVGDYKFQKYQRIESGLADRWKGSSDAEGISGETRKIAEELGYEEFK
jgi:acyl carrier protein/LPS sulfotransferase NodH